MTLAVIWNPYELPWWFFAADGVLVVSCLVYVLLWGRR